MARLLSFALTAAFLYVAFTVPLGRRTLAEHVFRIAETEPARELGVDVAAAGTRLIRVVDRDVRAVMSGDDADSSRTAREQSEGVTPDR